LNTEEFIWQQSPKDYIKRSYKFGNHKVLRLILL